MQVSDQRGLSYSAEDPAAVEAFDAVMLGYLNYAADTMDRLSALVRDHDLPMAQCFRACLLKMGSDPRFRPMLTDIVAALDELLRPVPPPPPLDLFDEMEQSHV